ncbi:putative gibberellin 3-beta-dioxygenase 2-3 [Iris pallida]|uniref:Gibberellin 3-beta-dioxygenase 2-3 n=1 Tax=Iris pallida TaxID=29817 RepID=A0AAX6FWX3_IRIPA|nr:putative gibberellin 3-beta-dioxygenase 2-3 [Iris pallida]
MPTSTHLNFFESVREVPDSHLWTVDDHPTSKHESVPVIDLSGPTAMAQLMEACEKWGAFQIVGHGIPDVLLDRFQAQLDRLFSLPAERKELAAQERCSDGLSGFGRIPIASFFSKEMWTEGFTIVGSPAEQARKMWPDDPHQFSDVIEEFNKEMRRLGRRLIRMMQLSLGLDEEEMVWDGPVEEEEEEDNDFTGALRLNSYPACPDPDRAMGMAAHTDSSLITLLYRSVPSGLQVLQDGSGLQQQPPGQARRWVAMSPVPARSLIVILGDLSPILTNGRFKSALHRVVVDRIDCHTSAAHFIGPPRRVTVKPAAKLVDPNRGPCYRAVSWPEYRDVKAKFFQQALESLKVSKE